MALNLSTVVIGIQGLELAIADVEKGIAQGAGSVVAEAVDSAEILWGDAAFKAAVLALVAAIKA